MIYKHKKRDGPRAKDYRPSQKFEPSTYKWKSLSSLITKVSKPVSLHLPVYMVLGQIIMKGFIYTYTHTIIFRYWDLSFHMRPTILGAETFRCSSADSFMQPDYQKGMSSLKMRHQRRAPKCRPRLLPWLCSAELLCVWYHLSSTDRMGWHSLLEVVAPNYAACELSCLQTWEWAWEGVYRYLWICYASP